MVSWSAHNDPMIFLMFARTKITLPRHHDDVGFGTLGKSYDVGGHTPLKTPTFDSLQQSHWQPELDELVGGSPGGFWDADGSGRTVTLTVTSNLWTRVGTGCSHGFIKQLRDSGGVPLHLQFIYPFFCLGPKFGHKKNFRPNFGPFAEPPHVPQARRHRLQRHFNWRNWRCEPPVAVAADYHFGSRQLRGSAGHSTARSALPRERWARHRGGDSSRRVQLRQLHHRWPWLLGADHADRAPHQESWQQRHHQCHPPQRAVSHLLLQDALLRCVHRCWQRVHH